MNIAFLSSLNPTDIHSWSGTLYYMYQSLSKSHRLTWIGGEQYAEVREFHKANYTSEVHFVNEKYASLFGKLFSDLFRYEYYDLIICRDYFFLSYLVTDVPVIYLGDTTFRLFDPYQLITDTEFIALANELERRSIQNATHLVYSSEWAKQSAINDYGAHPDKISVIEFGANIDDVPSLLQALKYQTCNLLFNGRNWKKKNGDKAIAIYQQLKEAGIHCKLTIIGSQPEHIVEDKDIVIYPHLDKSRTEDRQLLESILQESHFLIAPTLFDCFGIVYCEAAAYGIPVLTSDVGGVSQAVREGTNGFLFSKDAPASDYVGTIIDLFTHKERYEALRISSRKEYETRLNWNEWDKRMGRIITELSENSIQFYIPVYAINMSERKERREHIIRQFEGRSEFEFHLVEACTHTKGTIGLWNSIIKIVRKAKEDNEEVIIICEDDHYFTEHYSPGLLLKEIQEAYIQGGELLSGGIGGFGQAIPTGYHRYWIDWMWCTQFIVIYSSLFDKILSYEFKENDTADGVLSLLSSAKMVIYPFISEQKDFGYSDVTQSNMVHQGLIREHFERSNKKLHMIEQIFKDVPHL